jgi:hypothetical protein
MKTCGICSHPERAAIDAALVANTSLRAIAGQYGTTKSALDRHRKHIPAALTKAKQASEVADATSLVSRVERLMSRMENICTKAMEQEHWTGAVGASRELRGCLELLGKLSGELKQPGVNLSIKQSFSDISISDLSDRQLEELMEVIGKQEFDERLKIERMSNEEIDEELSRLTGIPAASSLGSHLGVALPPDTTIQGVR